MADKKKKRSGFTVACVVLVVLVCFIVFLVKKDTIITNLKETNFFERVFGATPGFVEKHEVPEKPDNSSEQKQTVVTEDSTVKIQIETEKKPAPAPEQPQPVKQEQKTTPEPVPEKEQVTKSTSSEKETAKNESVKTEVPITELQLCFVEIDSEGSVVRKLVKRSIPKDDSPLSTALKLLLKGPDSSIAAEKNCQSLIPAGTKLLGIKIQNGIAYLDFSEDFEINTFGVEGYNAQLMQIVYTATSFSTVKSVQFLIEGEKKEYLGSEGQWIGSPLSRNAF